MKICAALVVTLILACIVNASVLDPVIENVVHREAKNPPNEVPGIWKKKTIWKPRWVKEWKSAKVMKPIWRKVWSPVEIREWVPIPKPPPDWQNNSTLLEPVKVTSKDSIPLWDPVPYPQSQQPPPPPSHPYFERKTSCGKNGCKHPTTFNHKQILEIIGSNRHEDLTGYSQGAEYSETVNHLTRVSPSANGWPPPNQSNFRFQNQVNFQELPSFLTPPRFQPQLDTNVNFHFKSQNYQSGLHPQNFQSRPVPIQVSHMQPKEIGENRMHQWTNLSSQNNFRSQLVEKSPNQLHKAEILETSRNQNRNHKTEQNFAPDIQQSSKFNFKIQPNTSLHSHVDPDFIQQAHLVGEYHYSEFDLPKTIGLEAPRKNTKEEISKEKDNIKPQTVKPKPQHRNKSNSALGFPTKINNPRVVENKSRQVRTDNSLPQISQFPNNNQSFSHIPAIKPFLYRILTTELPPFTKEISLTHTFHQLTNTTNNSSPHTTESIVTKPPSVYFSFFESNPNSNKEKSITYEIFPFNTTGEIIKFPNSIQIFSNSLSSEVYKPNQNSSTKLNNDQKSKFENPFDSYSHPVYSRQEEPKIINNKTNSDKDNEINGNDVSTRQSTASSSTETTTPFTVYPSSFPSTTEQSTKSPVYVVTPIYVAQS